MSIEKLLGDLIEAVNANTEALKSGGSTSGKAATNDDAGDGGKATTGRGRGRSAPKDDKPKHTAEDVKAAAVKVKEELGTKEAKALIKKHGADELAKLKPEVYSDFIADCEKALNGGDDEGGGDDGDGDGL